MGKKLRYIKVHPHSFHTMLDVVQAFEKKHGPILVQNEPLSKFLLKASDFESSSASIPNEVKIAILKTYGINNPDPTELKEDKEMSDFGFGDIQNIALTSKFNIIAKNHNTASKTITIGEVQNCTTIKDCIDLVTTASAFSFNSIPTP